MTEPVNRPEVGRAGHRGTPRVQPETAGHGLVRAIPPPLRWRRIFDVSVGWEQADGCWSPCFALISTAMRPTSRLQVSSSVRRVRRCGGATSARSGRRQGKRLGGRIFTSTTFGSAGPRVAGGGAALPACDGREGPVDRRPDGRSDRRPDGSLYARTQTPSWQLRHALCQIRVTAGISGPQRRTLSTGLYALTWLNAESG